ncbi:pseudouridylate synthase [Pseudonocardiaceae bacterium YIM PH 21723]|nr:pseudouridylate synthase [Pseudonocardiaceae bacterium YIM PH 21723]
MRRKQRPPLPQRHGLDPVRMRMPEDGHWLTVREHLIERLPRVDPARIAEMLSEGRIVTREGPLGLDAEFVPGADIWFHRDLPDEPPVPFEMEIVHRDELLLVVHKPHFLATIPRGRHILETALVRLRTQLDLPDLTPAHRLDRVTAGLLMFVVEPTVRGRYQTLFRDRRVHKEYEAIAPVLPGLELPRTVRSRIMKERGVIAAFEEPGEPNAETHISLLESRGDLGRYRLVPATGRTHQLRLHLSGLGIPILGDTFYPVLQDTELDDYRRPLQLLARELSFVDPVTGENRRFVSPGVLQAWSDYDAWSGS